MDYFLLMHKKLLAVVTSRRMSWYHGRDFWTALLVSISSKADILLRSSATKLFACERNAFALPTLGSVSDFAMILHLKGTLEEAEVMNKRAVLAREHHFTLRSLDDLAIVFGCQD